MSKYYTVGKKRKDKSPVTSSRNVIIFRLFITFNMIIELSKSKMQNRNDPYHFGIFFKSLPSYKMLKSLHSVNLIIPI